MSPNFYSPPHRLFMLLILPQAANVLGVSVELTPQPLFDDQEGDRKIVK